jgi:two-component system phosphate regulon sensor histidine kinase PhoR
MKKFFDFLEIPLIIILSAIIGSSLLLFELPGWLAISLAVMVVLFISKFFRYILSEIDKLENLPTSAQKGDKLQASEKELAQSPTFASHAFDAIKTPIFILDQYSRINLANLAAKKRFAIETLGARVETSVRSPEILRAIEMAMEGRKLVAVNIEHHFPESIYENIEITPFNHDGRFFYIVSLNDETNLRKAEKMRVDFLANAGHELRTPLSSIRGFLETLQGSAKNDEAARERFLKIMVTQGERMSRLINDILSLSKIELNEHLPPKDNVKLNEILEFAINSTAPIAESYKSEITFNHSEIEVPVIGQADQIQQIIINLLENALKYGMAGEKVSIYAGHGLELENILELGTKSISGSSYSTLCTPQKIAGQTYSYVRIENSGKGIEKKYMSRLSERFYRIDDESAHIKGTGLGLAIVKHIINRHKGGFLVESAPHEKTAFTFFIPN